MQTGELIKQCQDITSESEEANKITFVSSMRKNRAKVVARCLVGKKLHNKGVNREGLRIALQQAWSTIKEVKIESLGSNIFMFKFASEDEKQRVMVGGLWHFDRVLIVLKEPSGIGDITKQIFSQVSFWVQILNVPLICKAISTI